MPRRSPAWFGPHGKRWFGALAALLLLAASTPLAAARDFIDSGGRRVVVPERINRIMAADPAAEVLVFVLTPQKLIGWAHAPQRGLLPAKYARLPVTGPVADAPPNVAAQTVRRLRPDLVIDAGAVTPARVAFADQVQQATGIPYILVDDSIARAPGLLRTLGALLGAKARGDDLGLYAEYAIDSLRGRLLVQSPTGRPRVYYGLGPTGLDAALPGTPAGEALDEAGAINVAAGLAPGAPPQVTMAQLRQWNPAVVIVESRSAYDALRRDPSWRKRKVLLAPASPFGWIDRPAGINRLIGLYWLSALLYPRDSTDDVGTEIHDFYEKFYGTQLSDKQIAAMERMAGITPPPAMTPAGPPGLLNIAPGAIPLPGTPPPGRGGLPPGTTSPTGLPPMELPRTIPRP